MTDTKKQYQEEQDKLLKTVLDLRFFNPWKHITKFNDEKSLWSDSALELDITSTCNQKCEYCYLQKYEKLYPHEINKPELILKNLRILFDYIMLKNYNIPCIDLFSGEIWATEFGWKVFDILIEYLEKGMKIDHIVLASNCSFVADDKAFYKMQQYIDKLNELNCPIIISISVDGKIVDDMGRPRNDGSAYTNDFYDKLFTFAKFNGFFFHPMVAANNVKYWQDNYKWWKKMDEYYDLDISNLMMLEVRNEGWTDENIKDYCDFLKMLMDDFFNGACHGNPVLFGNAICNARQKSTDPGLSGYIPWAIGFTDTFTGCTVSNHLTVRLGDLAICPCHRQAYEEYLYGRFNVENDKIVGISAINPLMAVKILMGNILNSTPLCDNCEFNFCCLHGCFGSQIEANKDPFFPIANICKFFKAKYTSIIEYYREHGIIEYLKTYSFSEPGGEIAALILQLNDALEAKKKDGMGVS